MDAMVFVLAFVALGALALRFGQDSREGIRSEEVRLAGHGLTWADLRADRGVPAATAAAVQGAPAIATTPVTGSYPTLAFIERALDTAAGTLTDLPDAARLEARARALTSEYWSDLAWTTGVVSEAAVRRVLAGLVPALAQAPVREVEYRSLEHVAITRQFLNEPESFLRHLRSTP